VRRFLTLGTIVAMVVGLFAVMAPQASADPPAQHRVTICHRTRSATHPYVQITVDDNSVDGNTGNDNGQGDHNAEHQGPVATSTAVAQDIKAAGGFWGDIIPPFYEDGTTPGYWPPLNWTTDGQTVFNNGCAVPGQGPEVGSITLTKFIPNVVEGTESYTISFQFIDSGNNILTPDTSCDFVFDASTPLKFNPQDGVDEPYQTCSISNLPFGTYTIHESDSGGFAPITDITVTVPDPITGDVDIVVDVTNSFGPATAQACKVTDAAGTGYDPTGDQFVFDLVTGSTVIDTTTVTYGTSTTATGGIVNNCAAFSAALDDNVTYNIVEETATGWTTDSGSGDTTFTPQYPDDADHVFSATYKNSLTPASAQACKVTKMNGTGHDASNDTFTFALKANGTEVETVDVKGGGTDANPNCKSFTTVLQDGVTYTITEKSSPTGYSQDSMVCDSASYTPSYPGASGHTYTCTATDSITPADATVQKVTNPTGHLSGWTFRLFVGTTQVGVGTTGANGKVDFGVALQDGVTYTIKEDSQTWWNSNGGVGDCTFTVHYPADSGKTFLCTFTNTEYTNGLTIGYWKNHLADQTKNHTWSDAACAKGLPSGTSCSTSGPFTKQYLPKTVGGLSVTTITIAANVFANNNCGGTDGKSAINCLAAQTLAAELNVANSANTCANGIIASSNSFLSGGTVDTVTGVNYTATPWTATISNGQKAEAVKLKTYLDTYNNGTCPI
jgi:hypothetical protein